MFSLPFQPLHFTSWVRPTETGQKNLLLCWQPVAVVKPTFHRMRQNKDSRLLSLFPCCYLSFQPVTKSCLCHLSGLLQPSMGCRNSALPYQVWPHHESLIHESGAPKGKQKLNPPLQIPDETTYLTAFEIWLSSWSFYFFHQWKVWAVAAWRMKENSEFLKMVALRQAFRNNSNSSFRRVNCTFRLIAITHWERNHRMSL